jgi:hypothetical protein
MGLFQASSDFVQSSTSAFALRSLSRYLMVDFGFAGTRPKSAFCLADADRRICTDYASGLRPQFFREHSPLRLLLALLRVNEARGDGWRLGVGSWERDNGENRTRKGSNHPGQRWTRSLQDFIQTLRSILGDRNRQKLLSSSSTEMLSLPL